MTPRRSARDSADSGDLDLFPRPEPVEHLPPPHPASAQPVAAPPLPAPSHYPGETAQSAISDWNAN